MEGAGAHVVGKMFDGRDDECFRDEVEMDGNEDGDVDNLTRPNQAQLGRRSKGRLVHCTTDGWAVSLSWEEVEASSPWNNLQ